MEFEEFFRQNFEGAELTPSPKVWENIEKNLNQQDASPYRWAAWWLGGAAAVVLLSFFAYLLLWNPVASVSSSVPATSLAAQAPAHHTTTVGQEKTLIHSSTTTPQSTETATLSTQSSLQRTIAAGVVQHSATPYIAKPRIAKRQPIAPITLPAVHQKAVLPTTIAINSGAINTTPTVLAGNTLFPAASSVQFSGLTALPFQPLPISLLRAEAVLLPIQTQTATAPQLAVAPKIVHNKTWIAVQGTYAHYNPQFSNVQDGTVPNAFLTNTLRTGLYNYDRNTFAKDLTGLQGAAWGIGVEVGKTLWKGLGVKSGLVYTQSNVAFDKEISAVVVSTTSILRTITITNTTQHLGVPLSALYQADWGKLTLGLHAGIQTDLLLGYTLSNSKQDEGHTLNFGNHKTITFSGLTGVQVGYQIVPNLQLFLESSYRTALSSVYDTQLLQAQPSWFSVGSSLRYNF